MKNRQFVLFTFLLLLMFPGHTIAGTADYVLPTVIDESYNIRALVPGASLYGGINGLAFDSLDRLYVGSVAGATIFTVDTNTGKSDVILGVPYGGADDIVFGPDGRMYWTVFFLGKIMAMGADGNIVTLADGLPGANALDFNDKGELYATQVFFDDVLWQIDISGKMKNRKVAEGLGGLNGFEFGKDGYIYGPLWFKHQVVKVDPATGKVVKVVADGFDTPCAVNFDSKGNLYALDTGTGEIFRIDIATGKKTKVAVQKPHLDNLAIDSKDRIYITNMNENGIYEVDVKTGKIRTVTKDKLVFPQGVAVSTDDKGDTLYVADNFAYKKVDGFTGEVEVPENGSKFVYTTSISDDGKHVVMSGWTDNKILVFDAKTDAIEYTITDIPMVTDTQMLADGSILALEGVAGKLIRIYDHDVKKSKVIATGLDNPTYMASAGAGSSIVYVTEFGSGKITAIDYSTGKKKTVAAGFLGAEGLALRPDGHLLVLDSVAKSLVDINPTTGKSTTIVVNLPVGWKGAAVGGPAASPFSDVAVSENGTIYVASPMANTIYKIFKKIDH